jgi:endonuclease/exonuclease/phosphatase family metal-dependent hydrolase
VFLSSNKHSVGPPVDYSPANPAAEHDGRILIVNWNVHLCHGNVTALLRELSRRESAHGYGSPNFVLLLQEAMRRDKNIPHPGRTRVPLRIVPPLKGGDIVDWAKKMKWRLFYAPSVRNGRLVGSRAEDRGNAILSNLPMHSVEQIELPIGVHRRIAVMAIIGGGSRPLFRVAAAHLDTRASLSRGWVFGGPAARRRQAEVLVSALEEVSNDGLPLIVGGDLNTHLGVNESSVRAVSKIVHRKKHGLKATHRSGLILDYIFARVPESWESGRCVRVPSHFGSDHYPLVLAIEPK